MQPSFWWKMDLIRACDRGVFGIFIPPTASFATCPYRPIHGAQRFPSRFRCCRFHSTPYMSFTIYARRRKSQSEPVLEPTIVEEVSIDDEEEDVLLDDFQGDEALMHDDDAFLEEEDDAQVYVGDGGAGGGISLAGTWWDEQVLALAEEVVLSYKGDFKIYAFRTLPNATVQVRIEKLINKSGSPSMEDIEAFSKTYRARLDEAELSKSLPENLYLEVSSPGVERIVRVPYDLDRFKDRPMYVKYISEVSASGSAAECDGIFKLISFDTEMKSCTWGLADVRKNREKAGKGRPLSKKQREWRLSTPFDTLLLVRLYSEI